MCAMPAAHHLRDSPGREQSPILPRPGAWCWATPARDVPEDLARAVLTTQEWLGGTFTKGLDVWRAGLALPFAGQGMERRGPCAGKGRAACGGGSGEEGTTGSGVHMANGVPREVAPVRLRAHRGCLWKGSLELSPWAST